MVEMASLARTQNMTREEILKEIIKMKTNETLKQSFEFSKVFSHGQIKPENYTHLFESINLGLSPDRINLTEEDIQTGFMMFSAVIFCAESVPLSQFLQRLVSTESSRTIIQATVNTIQATDIKEHASRRGLNKFYQALDKIFHFQLGKILLATSPPTGLESMLAKDWPYFRHYSQQIDQCLGETSCHGVKDLLQSIGETWPCMQYLIYFLSRL